MLCLDIETNGGNMIIAILGINLAYFMGAYMGFNSDMREVELMQERSIEVERLRSEIKKVRGE